MEAIRLTVPNGDLKALIKELDAYLKVTDQDEHDYYNQYNTLDSIKHFVLVYEGTEAVACGAFRKYDASTVEVKRMYTKPNHRGIGYGIIALNKLEAWAAEEGATNVILETGKRQKEAILFYEKCGYHKIPKYDQYKEMENSVCFGKRLV